jgi:hypothetical protein
MQLVRAGSAAALFLLLGTIVPAYAQHDGQDEGRGKGRGRQQQGQPQERHGQHGAQSNQQQRPQQQPRARQSQEQRPQQQQQRPQQQQRVHQAPHERPQYQQARPQQQPHRAHEQAAAWQQQRGWLNRGGWQGRGTWQQNRAQRWDHDHRSWAQRGGYGGYYIPQDRFSLYFGSRHGFRMHSRPTIYMGYPRFSYGGFSFLLVDPWPEYWPETWYDSDDLYIDYNDGYYLYDRRYPSVALAISVVL